MADILDSYSESNANDNALVWAGNQTAWGQSFAVSASGYVLDSCKFQLSCFPAAPTGSGYAKLYSHSGTYGTSSLPNTLLATSDAFNVATLTENPTVALVTFNFSGANRVSLANGTNYVIVFEFTGGDEGHKVVIDLDSSSPSHGGNSVYYDGSWHIQTTTDIIFYVYGAAGGGGGVRRPISNLLLMGV